MCVIHALSAVELFVCHRCVACSPLSSQQTLKSTGAQQNPRHACFCRHKYESVPVSSTAAASYHTRAGAAYCPTASSNRVQPTSAAATQRQQLRCLQPRSHYSAKVFRHSFKIRHHRRRCRSNSQCRTHRYSSMQWSRATTCTVTLPAYTGHNAASVCSSACAHVVPCSYGDMITCLALASAFVLVV